MHSKSQTPNILAILVLGAIQTPFPLFKDHGGQQGAAQPVNQSGLLVSLLCWMFPLPTDRGRMEPREVDATPMALHPNPMSYNKIAKHPFLKVQISRNVPRA